MNTKVCLLIRVSSEKQDTRRQFIELTDFCKKNKFTIARTISSKISGAKNDRPDIKELLAVAKRREFTKVIVTEISRLGRKAKDIRHTIDRLHEMNVSIVFKNFACNCNYKFFFHETLLLINVWYRLLVPLIFAVVLLCHFPEESYKNHSPIYTLFLGFDNPLSIPLQQL